MRIQERIGCLLQGPDRRLVSARVRLGDGRRVKDFEGDDFLLGSMQSGRLGGLGREGVNGKAVHHLELGCVVELIEVDEDVLVSGQVAVWVIGRLQRRDVLDQVEPQKRDLFAKGGGEFRVLEEVVLG